MWTYFQSTGLLSNGSKSFQCYSGNGEGKNNPEAQEVRSIGPIPRGLWKMTCLHDSDNTGPFTIILEPEAGTQVFGRSEFRIHGDSKSAPGTASHGCIIRSPRSDRQAIWNSGDHSLMVVR